MKNELIRRMYEVGAIKFGEFVLSSGKRSKIYIDVKIASTYPDILDMMAELISSILASVEFDKIACVELGGVPIAVATSLKMNKPLVIFRKEKKQYGLKDDRIGTISPGEKFVVVEDVVTTGKSALSTAKRVEESGGIVKEIVAVVDREEAEIDVKSVLKLSELVNLSAKLRGSHQN